ncbi:hypothetical protein C8P64_3223 [Christiangramia gaetbulicola]|uniref:LTXXQ motif family protein n=1 Tax=Christiangramia gaetbulicola TaxID=703340 RepID=A0A2T6AD32_9FLAO|nr:hypothetical protein [Christiangramia gaetbulicola]PTX41723.1 hypothetical protein C8P64_3223 [Christiangramia gaetbulicola]
MKRITILAMLFAFISMGAIAQVKEKHHESHNIKENIDTEAHAMMYADKVTTRLNLSLEQKEKIQEAQMKRLQHEKEMMAEMMHDTGEMGEMKKKKMHAYEDEFMADMKNILTPAQYQKWLTMHEREKKMHY